MGEFQFGGHAIDNHIEKIGADVRPALEIGMEKQRILEFYSQVSARFSDLFETPQMSGSEFRILKKFVVPGKGEMEFPTFALTQRGPAFSLPRRIAAIDSEVDLPPAFDTDKRIVEALKMFLKVFPQRQILRVGKLQEYVFDCGDIDSTKFIADRFTRVKNCKEVVVRFNLQSERYNKIFQLSPATKMARSKTGDVVRSGYGIELKTDFNNVDLSTPLEIEDVASLLHAANQFHEHEAFETLNGIGGEE